MFVADRAIITKAAYFRDGCHEANEDKLSICLEGQKGKNLYMT